MFRRLFLVATVAVVAVCGAACGASNTNNNVRDLSGEQVPDDMGTVDLRRPARDISFVDPDLAWPPTDDMDGQPSADMTGQPPADMTGQPPTDMAGQPTCTQIAAWPQARPSAGPVAFDDGSGGTIAFTWASMGDTAKGAFKSLDVEDWSPTGPYPRNTTFSATSKYNTCVVCPTMYECSGDDNSTCTQKFFAQAGSVNITSSALALKGRFTATATNLRLVEWDFGATAGGHDKPVTNGRCYDIASASWDVGWNFQGRQFAFGDFITDGTSSLTVDGEDIAKASAYDVSADGARVAVGRDTTVANRFDLFVGPANDLTALTSRAVVQAAGSVKAIRFSPDGNKLAYIADGTTAGQSEVYVVDFAGATAPVKVSLARPASGAQQPRLLSWSRDGKYLAFTADFQTNNKYTLYVSDVSTASPTTVIAVDASLATGSSDGVDSPLLWTAGGKLLVKAGLSPTATKFRLYQIDPTNNMRTALGNLTAFDEIGGFGLSPDGVTLVFSANTAAATTTYDVFTMPATGASAPTRLFGAAYTVPTGRGVSKVTPMVYSANGARIAFTADFSAMQAGKYEPYVVAAAGGAPVRVGTVGAAATSQSATLVTWAPDGSGLFITADERAAGDREAFVLPDITKANEKPVLWRGTPTGGDIGGSVFDIDHFGDIRWAPAP